MRIISATVLCFAALLANPYFEPDPANTGMGALKLWPTARSTALAGAMTGLADEADATYFNPAGLAFQTTAKASLDCANLLPGLVPGMYYVAAAGGAPLRVLSLRNRNVYVSGSLVYFTLGEREIVNERGVWRGNAAAHVAVLLTNRFSAGIGLKVAHNSHPPPDAWSESGEPIGEATTAAVDLAVLYRPLSQVSIGAAVANLGPHIVYEPSGEVADPPRMARLGLCWSPVDSRHVRLRVMPELDEPLVRIFWDSTGTKPFGRKLEDEWKNVWKAVGVEATAFNFVALRLGYFEDLTSERHGLCWGMGIGSDRLRFDFSSDAAIYDFPTSNWKIQLTSNDIGGLF